MRETCVSLISPGVSLRSTKHLNPSHRHRRGGEIHISGFKPSFLSAECHTVLLMLTAPQKPAGPAHRICKIDVEEY